MKNYQEIENEYKWENDTYPEPLSWQNQRALAISDWQLSQTYGHAESWEIGFNLFMESTK